jgi:PhnB protein
MQLNPHLTFSGQGEAAFKFYEQSLGGKIVAMVPHAGSRAEAHTPVEWRDKILHAQLIVGDGVLMGSDVPPDRYEASKGFSVTLGVNNPAEAERIFNALAEKGTVQMPLQQTFWAVRFGMLVDRFRIPWMIKRLNAFRPAASRKTGCCQQQRVDSARAISRPNAAGYCFPHRASGHGATRFPVRRGALLKLTDVWRRTGHCRFRFHLSIASIALSEQVSLRVSV